MWKDETCEKQPLSYGVIYIEAVGYILIQRENYK